MKRTIIVMLATSALAVPAIAQQSGQSQEMQRGSAQQQSGQKQTGQQQGQQQQARQQGASDAQPRMVYDAQSLDQGQLRQVQQALNQKGFDAGNVDGNWGAETRDALRNFQQAQGLKQTGQLDSQTISALGVQLDQAAMHYDAQELSQQQIQQVQRSLNQKGFDAGTVDGKWNSRTQSALRNFQQAQGMKQTGSLDQKTVSSLGVDFAQQESGQTTGASPKGTGSGDQQGSQQSGQPASKGDKK